MALLSFHIRWMTLVRSGMQQSAAIPHFELWDRLHEGHVVQLWYVQCLELCIQHIPTAKVLLRKFNWNTGYPGVWGKELHHWEPAVGVVALLAPFFSVLASKQGSALLHIPYRWTTHKGIKLSAGRNLFQRLYRCRCSSERKLGRMQHRDFESNPLFISRRSSATVLKCQSPSSLTILAMLVQWAHASSCHDFCAPTATT